MKKLVENIPEWIYSDFIQMHFIMQVGSRGAASFTYECHGFTPFDKLSLFYKSLFEVGVFCHHTISVIKA